MLTNFTKTNSQNMDKKIIIGLLVITGIVIGFHFYNKGTSLVKKDYNDKRMASKQEGLDFYKEITKEGQWSYSSEGINKFAQLYSESVSKGNHNRMMDAMRKSKDKRSESDTKFIDDNFNSVVAKLTSSNE
jgi:hypothetical protein